MTGNKDKSIHKIPLWLKAWLKPEEYLKIIEAIQEAEKKTDVEFVPLIVKKSIPTIAHVYWIIRLVLLLLTILSFELLLQHFWITWQTELILFVISLIAIYLISFPIARSSLLIKSLFKKSEIDICLERRAIVEFYSDKMHQTTSRTVVLIMISLLERRAIILADPSLNDRVDPKLWHEELKDLIQAAKNKKLAEGFCRVISTSAEKLSSLIPPTVHQTNEFPDIVLIKE